MLKSRRDGRISSLKASYPEAKPAGRNVAIPEVVEKGMQTASFITILPCQNISKDNDRPDNTTRVAPVYQTTQATVTGEALVRR